MSLHVLSLGAGVQSSCVALMSAVGALPRLDHAIFADTGWEPALVYEWLDALTGLVGGAFPIHRVSAGNLREASLSNGHRFISLPLYVRQDGPRGMVRRQCTKEFKITPIRRRIRELLAEAGEASAVQWFGISLDEVQRMRDPDVRYVERNYYPLVEQRMTRWDCLQWMDSHGFPRPPRSACIGCPFHSDSEWRDLRTRPDEWADAVAFDRAIRNGATRPGAVALQGEAYLHRSLVPLDEVDLSTPEERGQGSLFDAECTGVCGV